MTDEGGIGLTAAVVFGVVYLLSGLVVAAPPAPDAPAAEVQRYFANHDGAIAASAWLATAAVIPYLMFLAVLRRRLERADSPWIADLAFGGGLLVAAAGFGAAMISLGLSLHPDFNPPETVRILADAQRYFAPLATGAVCALAIAVAIGGLRADVLPLWAGVFSLAYAVYEVFESFTILGGEEGGFAPGEAVNVAGTIGFLVWAVAIGAALARPYPRGDAPEGHRQAG